MVHASTQMTTPGPAGTNMNILNVCSYAPMELVNVSPSGDDIDKHAVCGIKCTTVPSAQKKEKRRRRGEKR